MRDGFRSLPYRGPVLVLIALGMLALLGVVFVEMDRDSSAREGRAAIHTERVRAGLARAADRAPYGESEPIDVTTAEGLYFERRYAEAARAFAAYTRDHADNAWGHYMIGLSAWKAGDLAQAEAGLRAALAIDGEHVKSHVNLARVLLDADRPAEALEVIRGADLRDAGAAGVQRVLARCHHALGHGSDAELAYLRAIQLDPRDGWALNGLGLLYIEQERFTDALAPLACAAGLDAGLAAIENNLGVALERTGHLGDAAQAYARAVAIDSGHARAALSLARVEPLADGAPGARVDLAVIAAGFDPAAEAARAAVGDGPAGPTYSNATH